jgi:hypothetical protein
VSARGTWAVLLAAALAAAGCSIPGTALARLDIRGTVTDADGGPIPGARVRIVLPEGFWQGVDPIDQDPSSFSWEELRLTVESDAAGRFEAGPATAGYKDRTWILPPLGRAFSSPPDLGFVVRLEDEHEYYVVQALPDRLRVRTLDRSDGRPLQRTPRFLLEGRVVPREFRVAGGETVEGRRVLLNLRRLADPDAR